MTVIISFRNRIHPSYFIGRDQTFAWFKEVFLYGPPATLYDPEIGYDGDPSVSKKAVSEIIPEMIGTTILNFMKQRVTYDDEQVKLIIADSSEKEKQVMLSNFKKLTEDELHKEVYELLEKIEVLKTENKKLTEKNEYLINTLLDLEEKMDCSDSDDSGCLETVSRRSSVSSNINIDEPPNVSASCVLEEKKN
jgi:hypothetical protein